jgi:hypothetical protein
MKALGLDSGRLSEFEQVQSSRSLDELLTIFSVHIPSAKVQEEEIISINATTAESPEPTADVTDAETRKSNNKLRRESDDESASEHRNKSSKIA